MDWDDLRIFLAVARTESLSAAGKRLKIDPATVGRRIARLESAMAARLFTKSPQGYAVTEEGTRLLPHAEAAEAALSRAGEVLGGPVGLSGLVRLGAPDGCATYLLPQVLARICDANPGLEVQIVALPRVFNLSRREADMAIAVSRPTAGRLTVQKIADYRLHLAAARNYLAAHGTPASRADLTRHRFVGYIPDMIFDKELDYLADLGIDRVTLASNAIPVQLMWLRAGAGLGMAHAFAMPFAPELVPVLPEIALVRSFWLIRHADDARSPRLSRFAEALASGLRAEVARLEGIDSGGARG